MTRTSLFILGLLVVTAGTVWADTKVLRVVVKGLGSVKAPNSDEPCRAKCDQRVEAGTQVLLTAEPDAGQRFVKWRFPKGTVDETACGPNLSCTIPVSQNRAVQAVFAPATHSLRVTREGPGKGTVTSQPDGIECGKKCTLIETPFSELTLTATPDLGFQVGAWGGACAGQDGPTCRVTLKPVKEGVTSVTVQFR